MAGTPTTRRRLLRTGAAALATGTTVGLAGCGSGGDGARTVRMTDDMRFEPETVTVPPGATVTWENAGEVAHTVTAYEDRIPDGAEYFASGGFDSERAARNNMKAGLVAENETYSHTFETSGPYGYYCIPHEGSGMVGTVRVRE